MGSSDLTSMSSVYRGVIGSSAVEGARIVIAMPHPLSPEPAASAPDRGTYASEDEPALVERARAGEAAAFQTLVLRHQNRAYAVALRITRSPSEAAEVVQDALVRVWRAPSLTCRDSRRPPPASATAEDPVGPLLDSEERYTRSASLLQL
jgi:hypothetical protein